MDPTTTPLSAALTVRADVSTPQSHRVWATITQDWAQGRATYGGLLAGLCVRALERVSQNRPMRAFTLNFSAPVAPGDVAVEVELLRSGKSLLHAQARLVQEDSVRAVMIGAFGDARPSEVRLDGPQPPAAPAPETLDRLPFVEGVFPTFTQHFDYRWYSKDWPYTGAKHGHVAGWVKPLGIDRVDTAVLAALADAFPSPHLPMTKAPSPTSTASWLVNFVGGPVETPSDAYWQLEADAISAGEGYANVDAKLWDANGALRLISRQLIAEFSASR